MQFKLQMNQFHNSKKFFLAKGLNFFFLFDLLNKWKMLVKEAHCLKLCFPSGTYCAVAVCTAAGSNGVTESLSPHQTDRGCSKAA